MAKTVKKTKTSKTNTKSSVKKVTKKSKISTASSIEDLGLNKVQAKTINTLFTKEKAGVLSISRITGIPRRKVMKTLEIQNLKTYSPSSYK